MKLHAKTRNQVNAALRAIKADPDWSAGLRFIAPANSPWTGSIVDLSVRGVVIVYQVHSKVREVEIIDIQPIFIG